MLSGSFSKLPFHSLGSLDPACVFRFAFCQSCPAVICTCSPPVWNLPPSSLLSPGFLLWSLLALLVYLRFECKWLLFHRIRVLRRYFEARDKSEMFQRGFPFSSPKCPGCSLSKGPSKLSVSWVFQGHPDRGILWASWLASDLSS